MRKNIISIILFACLLTSFTGMAKVVISLSIKEIKPTVKDKNNFPVKKGKGFYFDGEKARVEFPKNKTPKQFTFMIWCAPEKQKTFGTLICKVGWHTRLGIDKNGRPSFSTYTKDKKRVSLSTKRLPLKKWVMLTGVCDGTNMVLYVNDKMLAFDEFLKGIYTSNSRYCIGCANPKSKYPDFFKGLINGARIWNMPLTPNKIAKIYQKEKVQYE